MAHRLARQLATPVNTTDYIDPYVTHKDQKLNVPVGHYKDIDCWLVGCLTSQQQASKDTEDTVSQNKLVKFQDRM